MNLMAYVVLALCVLLAVAGVVADVEYRHAKTLTTQLAAAKDQITADGTALTQEKLTTAAFQAAAAKWQQDCAPAAAAAADVAQLAALQAQLTAARRSLAAQETQDAKLPQCAAVLNQDLGAVCPDIAGGLRQLPGAGGDVRGSAGTGAHAGGETPAR